MAWGSSFDKPANSGVELLALHNAGLLEPEPNNFVWPVTPDLKPMNVADWNILKKEHTNKVPTHDPYTNPNAIIYYECNCGQILDPGTKRFAELNNCASNAGWKIRFSDSGYTPYCVECGKGVE